MKQNGKAIAKAGVVKSNEGRMTRILKKLAGGNLEEQKRAEEYRAGLPLIPKPVKKPRTNRYQRIAHRKSGAGKLR